MTVGLPGGKSLRVVFDECPQNVISVSDVKEAVAAASGLPLSTLHLVRKFPTLRPVRFIDGHLLFGFEGVMDRGLWAQPPYPGPVRPATNPTPPGMCFEVVDQSEIQFLEQEEEWWEQLNRQHNWYGHEELLAGDREILEMRLEAPRQPQFYGGPNGTVIHDRQQTLVTNATGAPLCTPDRSTLRGLATMHEGVHSLHQTVCGEQLYLPGPDVVAQEGTAFIGHERGVSFGDAAVKCERLGINVARYRVQFDGDRELKLRVIAEVADPTAGNITEHVWDGTVTRGAAGVVLFKGIYHAHSFGEGVDRCAQISKPNAVHDCLRTPFALFQKTQADTVPDVVNSKIGRRKADLTDRLFTIMTRCEHGGQLSVERVGKREIDECDAPAFFEILPAEPRLVFVSLWVRNERSSSETLARVQVVWCDSAGLFGVKGDGQLLATCDTWGGIQVGGDSFESVQHQLRKIHGLTPIHVGRKRGHLSPDPTPSASQSKGPPTKVTTVPESREAPPVAKKPANPAAANPTPIAMKKIPPSVAPRRPSTASLLDTPSNGSKDDQVTPVELPQTKTTRKPENQDDPNEVAETISPKGGDPDPTIHTPPNENSSELPPVLSPKQLKVQAKEAAKQQKLEEKAAKKAEKVAAAQRKRAEKQAAVDRKKAEKAAKKAK